VCQDPASDHHLSDLMIFIHNTDSSIAFTDCRTRGIELTQFRIKLQNCSGIISTGSIARSINFHLDDVNRIPYLMEVWIHHSFE
jgi:hypothetical protein